MEEGISQTSLNASAQKSQVTLLLNHVTQFQRAPKGFKKSWLETQQADEESIAKVFLNVGGFSAWLAYFLTHNAAYAQYHLTDKAERKRLLAYLENASVDYRKSVAEQVAAAIPEETAKKITGLYHRRINPVQNDKMPRQPNKRRREYSVNAPYPSDTVQVRRTAMVAHRCLQQTCQARPWHQEAQVRMYLPLVIPRNLYWHLLIPPTASPQTNTC